MKQKLSTPLPKKSAASRYKEHRLLTVKLPTTGDEIQIRRIDFNDILAMGGIPAVFLTEEARKASKEKDVEKLAKLGAGNEEYADRFTKTVCTRCVIDPGFRIVDKPANECGENEVPYEAVAFLDRQAIQGAVVGESGLGSEVAQSAKPFPQEQKTAPTA